MAVTAPLRRASKISIATCDDCDSIHIQMEDDDGLFGEAILDPRSATRVSDQGIGQVTLVVVLFKSLIPRAGGIPDVLRKSVHAHPQTQSYYGLDVIIRKSYT